MRDDYDKGDFQAAIGSIRKKEDKEGRARDDDKLVFSDTFSALDHGLPAHR
jgi:hypothetical protein